MKEQKMRRLIGLLRVLIYLSVMTQIGQVLVNLATDQKIYLVINGEIWSRPLSAFNGADQLFISTLLTLPTIALVWGMGYIGTLCRLFELGLVFSMDAILCFKRFALSLLAVSIFETATIPVLIAYLVQRGVLASAPEPEPALMVEMIQADIFLVGLLFFVIAKILQAGSEMKSELELTV